MRSRVVIALACLSIVVAACGSPKAASPSTSSKSTATPAKTNTSGTKTLTSVKIAWQPTPDAPLFEAMQKGLFKKEGFKPHYYRFDSGPAMMAAMQHGNANVASVSNVVAVNMMSRGIPVNLLTVDVVNIVPLVARKGSGIHSLSDLQGKKIGVVRGTIGDYVAHKLLAQAKVTNAHLVYLSVPAILPAFENGNIDAAIMWPPWYLTLEAKGGTIVGPRLTGQSVWVVNRQWAKKNPGAVKRFVQVLSMGRQQLEANPSVVEAFERKMMKLTPQQAKVVVTGPKYPSVKQLANPSYAYSLASSAITGNRGEAADLKSLAVFLHEAGVINKVPNFAHAIDSTALSGA